MSAKTNRKCIKSDENRVEAERFLADKRCVMIRHNAFTALGNDILKSTYVTENVSSSTTFGTFRCNVMGMLS